MKAVEGTRGVVVGGGVAGLLAATALARCVDRATSPCSTGTASRTAPTRARAYRRADTPMCSCPLARGRSTPCSQTPSTRWSTPVPDAWACPTTRPR